MRPAAALTALALFAAGSPSGADTRLRAVELVVEVGGGRTVEEGSLRGKLVAEPVGVLDAGGDAVQELARIEQAVALPGPVSLSLPPGLVWSLHFDVAGYWHEAVVVADSGAERPRSVVTALMPLATVEGSIAADPRQKGPEGLRCAFRRVEDAGALDLRSWREVPASLEEGRFRCSVPAGTLHLEVHASGWVPHYFWDLGVGGEAPTSLGELRWQRGGSLAGVVQVEGPAPETPPEVVLQYARMARPSPPVERRLEATAAVTEVGPRGFFHFEGISPGSYVLVASGDGLAAARLEGLDLLHEAEYVLDEPLVLRPPASLELRVDPPVHPYGVPWQATLLAVSGSQSLRTTGRAEVSAAGAARFEGLVPGEYRLEVVGPNDSAFAFLPVMVDGPGQVERIELPLIELNGRLWLGDEPAAGTLLFGGRDSAERIVMETDEEGRFEGHLPHAGRWAVDVQHLDGWFVRAPAVEVPEAERRVEVAIELPGGELAGEVVDESGAGVAGAGVMIFDAADRRPALRGSSDAEGAFRIRGVDAGSYLANAGNGEASSDWVAVSLGEDEMRSDLRLVLRRRRTVPGTVRGPRGPVPGARVELVPDTTSGGPAWVASDVTGPDGAFALSLPHSARSGRIVVYPPGHALAVRRISLGADPIDLRVAEQGGTLVLRIPPDQRFGAVYHSGIELPLSFLREWAKRNGSPAGNGSLVVPAVAPGEVHLCTFATPPTGLPVEAILATCPSGRLTPGGLLSLAPKPDAAEGSS